MWPGTFYLTSFWVHFYYYSFQSIESFFPPALADSFSPDFEWQQVSTLLGLFTVFWLVSTRPLTSKSSNPCAFFLVIVPRAPITIGITVTFMFHSFSIPWQGPGTYLASCILLILLYGLPGQQSPQLGKFVVFLLMITTSGRLAEISLYLKIPEKFVRNYHPLGHILGCAYTIVSHGQIQN